MSTKPEPEVLGVFLAGEHDVEPVADGANQLRGRTGESP